MAQSLVAQHDVAFGTLSPRSAPSALEKRIIYARGACTHRRGGAPPPPPEALHPKETEETWLLPWRTGCRSLSEAVARPNATEHDCLQLGFLASTPQSQSKPCTLGTPYSQSS